MRYNLDIIFPDMRKSIFILYVCYSCCVNLGCSTKKEPVNVFENIEKYRTVWTGTDSLQLNPFEFLVQFKFKNFDYPSLQFESQDSLAAYNTCVEYNCKFFPFHDDYKNYIWTGKSLILKFNDVNREILKNETYQAILGYNLEISTARNLDPEEYLGYGCYYIIDIVLPGHKFARQTNNHNGAITGSRVRDYRIYSPEDIRRIKIF